MLKGKSVIELTDVRTNEKEVYEDENLITNAVPDLLRLNPMGLMYPVRESNNAKFDDELFPIANKCYGGILLFENPLEEDPNKYIPPGDNPIIGYSSNDVNPTDNPKRGSANLTESVPIENGYKFVWDFSTSQANGRISSLALTHYRGGKYYYGDNYGKDPFILLNKTSGLRDRNISDIFNGCVEMNIKNNTIISIWPKNNKSIDIVKVKEPFVSIGLNDPIFTKGADKEEKITLDLSEFYDKFRYWYKCCFHDGKDGYWYGFSASSNNLIRVKINKETYEISTDVWSLGEITLGELGSYKEQTSSYCEHYRKSCIRNGYLYAFDYYSYDKIYKININNPVDISILELDRSIKAIRYSGEYSYLYNWGDYILGYEISIDANDKVIVGNKVTDYDGEGISNLMVEPYNIGPFMVGFGGYEDKFYKLLYLHTPYLGTINNLSSPILKTADKTMKITYTLTETE